MSLDFLTWDNVTQIRYEIARAVPSVVDLPPLFADQTTAPSIPASRNKSLVFAVAKRRNLSTRELAASGGVYTGSDQVWILPDALFPANTPSKPGDVVVEVSDGSPESIAGMRWTVLENGWGKNRQTRRLTCRNLTLAFDLRDTVTIERPAIRQDAAGVNVKAFPSDAVNPGGIVLYAALPGRAQLISKDVEEERGIRGLLGKYQVIVGQDVDVTSEDRVLLSNGLYLDIVGYQQAMRIDQLPFIVCERRA